MSQPRRREARLLVCPFVEALVEPHVDGERGRGGREVLQDCSTRAVSFFTQNPYLIEHADRIRAVTVICPDGLRATLGIARSHVRPVASPGPVRLALEYEHPRPPVRSMRSLQRLGSGMYVPQRPAEAIQALRAFLGADESATERRASTRIRVALERGIRVELLGPNGVVGSATLADVSPQGFGAIGSADLKIEGHVERVRLVHEGEELLVRDLKELMLGSTTVRGIPCTRVRMVLTQPSGTGTLAVPEWVGALEFGALRPSVGQPSDEIVQAALLARDEVRIEVARDAALRRKASVLAYEGIFGGGDVSRDLITLEQWLDDPSVSLSDILVTWAGNRLVGTVRVVRPDPEGRLPWHHYTPREHWPELTARMAEGGRVAVSPLFRRSANARVGLFALLIVAAARHARSHGFEWLVGGIRDEHFRLYERLGFQGLSARHAHVTLGAPTRLVGLDLSDLGALQRLFD